MTIEQISRVIVLASLLAAAAAGILPYSSQPGIAVGLAATVVASAAVARLRLTTAAYVVLLFAYIAYGLQRMAGGSELAATPFWLAAFVGLVAGSAPWGRWQAPSPWRLPIAWWALGIAVSWPVVAVRETGFALDDPAVAGAIVGAAVVQMACAVWLDTVLAALADATAERREAPLLRPLMASALVTALAAVYQRFGDIAWLSGESWVRLGRATGMMGDANPMGVVTALIAPLMLGGVLAGRPLHAILPAAGALLLWTAAWASGARSTLILLAAGFAGLAIAWGASRGIGLLRIIGAGMVLAVLAAALLVFALPRLPASSPVARLVAALPAASPGAVLYELLWRRDGYGEAAVEAIADHPLNGVGIGRFTALAPVYFARVERRAIPPDNAQNLWRHTFAERGLLGFVPVAWLTLLTLMAICRWTADPWQIVLNVMIAGLGVVLMFGYPVQDPAVAATVATLAGIAGRQVRPAAGSKPAAQWVWMLVLAAAIAGAVLDGLG